MSEHRIKAADIYRPRPWQAELHAALARKPQPGSAMTVTAICHRAAGKSVAAAAQLFFSCLSAPSGFKAAFVSPYLKQSRSIIKQHIDDMSRAAGIDLHWDAQDNVFTFPNGAKLYLGATENNAHEMLRGHRFEIGMVLDEAAFMGHALDALLPTLSGGRQEGWLLAIGTPRSLDDPLSQLYAKGLDPNLPNHVALLFSIEDTGLFTAAEIEAKRLASPSDLAWRREWLADPYAGGDASVLAMQAVIDARSRKMPPGGLAALRPLPKVIGVDPSFGGADEAIAVTRIGNVVLPPRVLPSDNTVATIAAIKRMIDDTDPDGVFMDASGAGKPLVDMLIHEGYDVVTGVQFGSQAPDPSNFAQMRSWMWWQLRGFIETAILPDDAKLLGELTAPTWKRTAAYKIQVETKDEMRKRGLESPDRADALALACAFSVMKRAHQQPMLSAYEQRFEELNGYRPTYDPTGLLGSFYSEEKAAGVHTEYDPFN